MNFSFCHQRADYNSKSAPRSGIAFRAIPVFFFFEENFLLIKHEFRPSMSILPFHGPLGFIFFFYLPVE